MEFRLERKQYRDLALSLAVFIDMQVPQFAEELHRLLEDETTDSVPELFNSGGHIPEVQITDNKIHELLQDLSPLLISTVVRSIERVRDCPRLNSLDEARQPKAKIYTKFDPLTGILYIYPDTASLNDYELRNNLITQIISAHGHPKKFTHILIDSLIDPERLSQSEYLRARNYLNLFEAKNYAVHH